MMKSLPVHLRLEARNQLRRDLSAKDFADTEIFFDAVGHENRLFDFLSSCGLDRTPLTDAWGVLQRPYPRHQDSAARMERSVAERLIQRAIESLVAGAREGRSPRRILTIRCGGKSGMPATGSTRKAGSRREGFGHN